jgi:DNA repair protein RadC
LIIVHNHPSGDPTPSKDDIAMTKQVRDALSKVGVVLHDHVVVGANSYESFKSLRLL